MLSNEILVESCRALAGWKWKGSSHFNIFKLSLIDSHVALCALTREELLLCAPLHPKKSKCPILGWNPADHPTRDATIPEPLAQLHLAERREVEVRWISTHLLAFLEISIQILGFLEKIHVPMVGWFSSMVMLRGERCEKDWNSVGGCLSKDGCDQKGCLLVQFFWQTQQIWMRSRQYSRGTGGTFLQQGNILHYHLSKSINLVGVTRPTLRRSLQQAWDLCAMWTSFELVEHHRAMPAQVLLAVLATCLVWGPTREAAIFLLCAGGRYAAVLASC